VKRLSFFIFLSLLVGLSSCGKTDEEKLKIKYNQIELALNNRDCTEAQKVLTTITGQELIPKYIKLKSVITACFGGFDLLGFFLNEIPTLASSSGSLLGSLTQFSYSNMTSPTDSNYLKIKSAINTLMYAGGVTSSSNANRSAVFGKAQADQLDINLLYLTLVQMGKFFQYYGEVDNNLPTNPAPTLYKGTALGSTSNCILTYTTAATALLPPLGTNLCNIGVTSPGSADLPDIALNPLTKTRLCEGIILFNNFIDLVANIDLVGSNVLSGLATNFTSLCSTAGITTCDIRDQAVCEATADLEIESFYAVLLEEQLP